MKKKIVILFSFVLVLSCAEKLIEKPENLIPRDKMVGILKDMTIINSAKTINIGLLKENGIEPTRYVFKKYDVDSIQFVKSDRYYASLPLVYESIYVEVETSIEKEVKHMEMVKRAKDSLELLQEKSKEDILGDSLNSTKD